MKRLELGLGGEAVKVENTCRERARRRERGKVGAVPSAWRRTPNPPSNTVEAPGGSWNSGSFVPTVPDPVPLQYNDAIAHSLFSGLSRRNPVVESGSELEEGRRGGCDSCPEPFPSLSSILRVDAMDKSMKQPFLADNPSMEIPKSKGGNPWENPPELDVCRGSQHTSLFSSSLPVLPHEKLNYMDANHDIHTVPNASSDRHNIHNDVEGKVSNDDLDLHAIGSHLPDDEDDLLAGITDDFDISKLPIQMEDLEEDDVFGSGGGLELDFDPTEKLSVAMARTSIIDGYMSNGAPQYGIPNGIGTVAGEHPYGEHPSRTLFVRNINSNVEDSELRALFEQYGDIRTLYTACKHRGFVMISYYDIRGARTAMRALQNKPLRRRKLDIHFSIPKDNPSEKDVNQGTLVVFNLDPSVSNDDLCQIFGKYGEVKEIRETPHKRHHKFIEFYDVRDAEAALKALNRSDIAGKRIKLEPSRPGGARRSMLQQWNQELEQDDARSFRHQVGSPIASSPPGTWGQFGSPGDGSAVLSASRSTTLGALNALPWNNLPGLASILPPMSNSIKDHSRGNYLDQAFNSSNSTHGIPFQRSHSSPEHNKGMLSNMTPSPRTLSSYGHSTPGASAVGTLTGPQFLWGSASPFADQPHSSAWAASSFGHSFTPNRQEKQFLYSNCHNSFSSSCQSYNRHHVGSAPSGVPLERNFSYSHESTDAFGAMGFRRNGASLMTSINNQIAVNPGVGISGNTPENGSGFGMIPSQRVGQIFNGSPYSGMGSSRMESLIERGRNQRTENYGNPIESKKQYQLELDKIISGEDKRTTLMIKNIPNKYTSEMLLAAIDENHKGTYDFLYLPIDFKNKCNVGYAFINMVSVEHIIPFYEVFNGKRWEKFNSEKIASLAYARIQGKAALVSHFQNSSLMNEDKRCRPILFHSEGPDAGDQEPFPSINNNTTGSTEIPVKNSSEVVDSNAQSGCSVPVWIQFPELPAHFQAPSALKSIASSVGKFLCFHKDVLSFTRPSLPSVCVEMDISRPLPKVVLIESGQEAIEQPIIYGPQTPRCRVVGHSVENCRRLLSEQEREEDVGRAQVRTLTSALNSQPQNEEGRKEPQSGCSGGRENKQVEDYLAPK